jgi:CMP-2-keto-3-deoxyoctulosonic acid synthetase
MSLKNKIGKILTITALHKYLKDKAVKQAKKKDKEEGAIDGQFYISMPIVRDWIDLETRWEDQTLVTNVIKIKSYLKNFGGENIKVVDSKEDTRLYFDMSRSSVSPMFKDIKKHYKGLTLGEVKLRKY